MKKTTFEIWTRYEGSWENRKESWFVEFHRRPWWRWIIWQAYEWYSLRVQKLPGFRTIEILHERILNRDHVWWFEQLCIRQDLKAYSLGEKGKEILGSIEIPRELAVKLNKFMDYFPPQKPQS